MGTAHWWGAADPLPICTGAQQNQLRRCAGVAVVRVLLVDDQRAFLRAMTAVIAESPGFEVVGQASSGEESVALAAELLPDLVLMDVNLTGIDGVQATRLLLEGDPAPVVLLLSTYDEDAGEQLLPESGATAYLTKSAFSPNRLAAIWRAAAHARR
jgi:two-component system, NarL family, invasion response regulator UvrY